MAYILQAAAFRPAGLDRPLRADHRGSLPNGDFEAYLRAAKPDADSSDTPFDEPPPTSDVQDADELGANTDQVVIPASKEGVPSTETAIPFIGPDAGGIPTDTALARTTPAASDAGVPTIADVKGAPNPVADPTSPIKPNIDGAAQPKIEATVSTTAESMASVAPDQTAERETAPRLASPIAENRNTPGTTNQAPAGDDESASSVTPLRSNQEALSPARQEKLSTAIHEASQDRSNADRLLADVDPGRDEESVLDRKLAKAIEDAKTGTNGDRTGDQPSNRFGPGRRAGTPLRTHTHSVGDSAIQAGDPALEANAPTSTPNVLGESGDRAAVAFGRFFLNGGVETAGNIRDFTPIPVARPVGGEAPSMPTTGLSSAGTSAETLGQVMSAGGNDADDWVGPIRLLSAAGGSGQSRATLQLNPPELGRLTIQVRMQQQAMELHVQVDRADVGRLIESRMGELRDALSVHGIRVERTDVVVRSDASSDANPQRQEGHAPTGGEQRDNPFSTSSEESRDGYGDSGTRNEEEPEGSHRGGREERDIFSEPRRSIEEIGVGVTPTAERSVDLVA
ncbi:MAG: flagellar hook-length control protein FliK [Planctomycetota bacterium]|nr:flagellar hook-length control protein FliK [Planctomycetota bacterium]